MTRQLAAYCSQEASARSSEPWSFRCADFWVHYTTLEALSYCLARRAYQRQVAWWAMFLAIVALSITFLSPWSVVLLCGIPLFDAVFQRWPLPMLVELRLYKDGSVEEFLKTSVAGRVGGPALRDRLRSYTQRGRLVWLLDGVNEVRGDVYELALEGWRECFTPGHYFAGAPVIFTSRSGENPTGRLGLKDDAVLEVLDLDDAGVWEFLWAYDSQDVKRDFVALHQKGMLDERGLGRNPYWLKMLVESGRAGKLTRNRGALFENFVRELINRELKKGVVRPQLSVIPIEDELEALGQLAYTMSSAGQVGLALDEAEDVLARWIERKKKEKLWTVEQILDEAEATTLMSLSQRGNRADFVHQLVQEFFTAYAMRLDPVAALSSTRTTAASPHDVYSRYDHGLRQLLDRIGRDHAHYAEALVYQQRLAENVEQSRRYGDTETRRAERAEVLERLSALSLSVLGCSFDDLCSQRAPIPLPEPTERCPLDRAQDPRWWETLLLLGGLLEEHEAEGAKKVGSHNDYCQFVRAVLSGGSDEHQLFLAMGLFLSVDAPDDQLESEVTAALETSLRRGVIPRHQQAAVELIEDTRITRDDVVDMLGKLLQKADLAVIMAQEI